MGRVNEKKRNEDRTQAKSVHSFIQLRLERE